MHRAFSVLLIVPFSFVFAAVASSAEPAWVSMFDGKNLDNWEQKNGTATYKVVDGTILGTTAKGSPNSFLCSKKLYGDFELEFEVKCHKRLNSGVQIRSQTAGKNGKTKDGKWGRVNGPQVEIESGPALAGYVYGEATGYGWLTPKKRLNKHDHFKNDGWNKYRVVAQGPRIQTWINGNKVEDLTHEAIYKTHPKGFIGLQVHGVGNAGPFTVAWRNLRIRELSEEKKGK